jgi:CheY-like chemotaxis protein
MMSPSTPGRFHLLLVEDDDVDALNVQRALRGVAAIESLVRVSDGVEALAWLRARASLRRVVVLSDIRMPRMSGLELLAALRGDPLLAALPVVFLTTSADDSDLEAAAGLHSAGYLTKSPDSTRFKVSMRAFADYWALSLVPQ